MAVLKEKLQVNTGAIKHLVLKLPENQAVDVAMVNSQLCE